MFGLRLHSNITVALITKQRVITLSATERKPRILQICLAIDIVPIKQSTALLIAFLSLTLFRLIFLRPDAS